MMVLLTDKVLREIPEIDDLEKTTKQTIVYAKAFNPMGVGTWYIIAVDNVKDPHTAFGICVLHEVELGYVSIDELKSIVTSFGMGIERDLSYDDMEHTVADAIEELEMRGHSNVLNFIKE